MMSGETLKMREMATQTLTSITYKGLGLDLRAESLGPLLQLLVDQEVLVGGDLGGLSGLGGGAVLRAGGRRGRRPEPLLSLLDLLGHLHLLELLGGALAETLCPLLQRFQVDAGTAADGTVLQAEPETIEITYFLYSEMTLQGSFLLVLLLFFRQKGSFFKRQK